MNMADLQERGYYTQHFLNLFAGRTPFCFLRTISWGCCCSMEHTSKVMGPEYKILCHHSLEFPREQCCYLPQRCWWETGDKKGRREVAKRRVCVYTNIIG